LKNSKDQAVQKIYPAVPSSEKELLLIRSLFEHEVKNGFFLLDTVEYAIPQKEGELLLQSR
jgi:hypothetical protein